MTKLHRLLASSIIFFIPITVFAVSVDEVMRVADDTPVTRGEFIRAAVKALDIDMVGVEKNLPYLRIPKAMEEYVRVAHSKGALTVFGRDLLLARPIKRGEALQILVKLKDKSSDINVEFRDVQAGTNEEAAVRVAMEEGWMDPLSENLYGVRRVLTGSDARILLRKVRGEAGQQLTPTSSQTIKVTIPSNTRLTTLPKTQILEAIWTVITSEYLYEDKIDADDAAYRAAEALLESLGDKYTSFFRPVKNRSFQTQLQGEVTGIGAQVEMVDGILTIVTPMVGSPAEAAGLKPGDQILMADDVSLKGLDLVDAVDLVRGEKGTEVKLHIRRNGTEFDVSVVRDIITVPEAILTWQNNILVLQLTQFGRLTQDELRGQLAELNKRAPAGVILDLRNNPGGLLNAAGTVLSCFVPKGTDVVEIRSRNSRRMDTTNLEPIMPDVPLVVLINGGSASASEIVAGALQDLDRATLVGTKTFGKGTVQEVLQFNDQSGMKLTIAEWYTPLGRKIDGKGISPDILVEKADGRDDQMVKALEILR